ncbi:MAG: hypothetical protein RML45_01160 [Acetobacteraceae bacterium]|nr:hypothetical protein [Acetobacteraceae bacterium]
MNNAANGAVGLVARRVGGLVGERDQFLNVGNVLRRDRVCRVGGVDQGGHGGGDSEGVALGDLEKGGPIVGSRKPCGEEGGHVAQGARGRNRRRRAWREGSGQVAPGRNRLRR